MNITDIPDGWKYLLGAITGGGIAGLSAILNSYINQNAQTKRERQKWQAEKLLDYYRYCIIELFEIESLCISINVKLREKNKLVLDKDAINIEIRELRKQIKKKSNDLQSYIYLIIITQNKNNSDSDFNTITKFIEDFDKEISVPFLDENPFNVKNALNVKRARESLINYMKKDNRVNQMFIG